jgi:hypothetical protein
MQALVSYFKETAAQHSVLRNSSVSSRKNDGPHHDRVHPTGGSLRVFRQFAWLEVGSVKAALPRPAHQRVTQAVSPRSEGDMKNE